GGGGGVLGREQAEERRAVETRAFLAVVLRPIEGTVGRPLQLLGGVRMRRIRRDSDADRHLSAGRRQGGDLMLERLHRAEAAHFVEIAENREFVTAEAERLRSVDPLEEPRELPEQLVTDRMAGGGGYALEGVDVE